MFRRIFFLGLTAGIASAAAALIFQRIHFFATYADFSKLVTVPKLIAVNLGVCMLAALLYRALTAWLGQKGAVIFNFVFVLLSFASVSWSFAYTLPLDVQLPELFPGLTVPMHFFPALAWFTFKPLFIPEPVVVKTV